MPGSAGQGLIPTCIRDIVSLVGFIEFYGAAGQVTGSLHRIQVNGVDILLECGLFQGHRNEANALNRRLPSWATQSECVVLSHAHLDHSGNLPSLVKAGFKGNVFCTPATRDLCSVMLRDSAVIQESDARYLNRRAKPGEERVEPLYSTRDAERAVARMISLPVHRPLSIAPGATLTFHHAGHVLGSAFVQLDLEEKGKRTRLLFTGDVGRKELPLLDSPEIVDDVDVMLMESTYGDREHAPFDEIDDELARIIRETISRGGKVFIPTFALERAQEVLFSLERLHERGLAPSVPIYIDSPLAIAVTEIYKLHPDSLSDEVCQRIVERNDPFSPPGLHYVSNVADSKSLQSSHEPAVIIAGSGMCEGGRILHHFRSGLGDEKNSVVIVGFMAQHTLGRRLVEGRRSVKILGVERDVRASVHVLNGLSAHAGRTELIELVRRCGRSGSLRQVALVHGEDEARESLRRGLQEIGIGDVVLGMKGKQMAI